MNALPAVTQMRNAVAKRDPGFDGLFYFGVRTTGIFCRPSCTSRPAKAENMEFFGSVREASFAGYRPCKRCHPLEANGATPNWMRGLLERIEREPESRIREQELRRLGVDPGRARRHFLRHFGMTFQAYARARRMGRALQQIKEGVPMDEVALGQGYESNSGFREAFARTFGRAPGAAREAPAASEAIVITWLESPVGPLLAGANAQGVVLLEFTERRMLETQFKTLRSRFQCAIVPGENGHLHKLRDELKRYFAGALKEFTVPLVYPGTPFQERCWSALLTIPYGETRSYEDMARQVGSPKAVRAVGTANGCNRIAIVIPCHRVVNKGGKLGGYGGGLWRKQILLDLEQGKRDLFA